MHPVPYPFCYPINMYALSYATRRATRKGALPSSRLTSRFDYPCQKKLQEKDRMKKLLKITGVVYGHQHSLQPEALNGVVLVLSSHEAGRVNVHLQLVL